MKHTNTKFGYDALAYFGRVNASISHELKNVMAIISETAGLLGDLSAMASSGTPVAPDMLSDCTKSIVEEIQRGFAVIRQMNRFSHSIDHPVESVNLMDVLDLSINLSTYLSFAGTTTIAELVGPPPVVATCPFLLQSIIYQTLVYTFKHTGNNADVTIGVNANDDQKGWKIVFSGFSLNGFQVFPDPLLQTMAESIGVTIKCDSTADWLELIVPFSIDKSAFLDGGNIG